MSDFQFDESYWRGRLKKPDWYLEFVPFAENCLNTLDDSGKDKFNKTVRHFFEKALQEEAVYLAKKGPDLDSSRLPVDTLVIHHTSAKAGYRLSYMEATQLLNIYARYYAQPSLAEDRPIKGRPIWSNHFRNGRQTFIGYHWLMRMDGKFIRLLDDDQIGWHAGNWQINRKSIGICLDNDYEAKDPDSKTLRSLALFIKNQYPNIKPTNIIGHCECRQATICPGGNFLAKWKGELTKLLES